LSADIDLFINADTQPTTTDNDCGPEQGGTTPESCSISVDTATVIHVGIYGFEAGDYTVTATVIGPEAIVSGQPVNGSVALQAWTYYSLASDGTETSIDVGITGLSADVDLYVRRGSLPTSADYDCRPELFNTSDEACSVTVGSSDTVFIGIYGYEAGNFTLEATVVKPGNIAPTASITAPASGSQYSEGDSITFTGTATDTEDGDITGGLTWSSTLQAGTIGTGGSFTLSSLVVGSHSISATVTDSGGLSPATPPSVDITVNAIGNAAPTASITAPVDGSIFTEGDNITFTGTADDAEDGDISSGLNWTLDPAGTLIGTGASFSISTLSTGPHSVIASVVDSGGLAPVTPPNVNITVQPVGNSIPVVTITSPLDGSSFTEGDSVTFTGTATDTEDGDIAASLSWSSDLDGALGTGASVSLTTLSVGNHTITATVTDSGTASGNSSITVEIVSTVPDDQLVSGDPKTGSVAQGAWDYYFINLDAGDALTVDLNGLSADIDLFINADTQPTTTDNDCGPEQGGTTPESCSISVDTATVIHVGIYGFEAGDYTVTATVIGPEAIVSGQPVNGSVALQAWTYYSLASDGTETSIDVGITGLSADVDLYVRRGSLPTSADYDCRPELFNTSDEACSVTVGSSDTVFIGIYGYEAGNFTLEATVVN